MKKVFRLILLLIICNGSNAWSQAQLHNWYIAPKKVDVSTSPPSVTTLPSVLSVAPQQAFGVANGMYDSNNNLLFYVADINVYDYNNTLIGAITPNMTSSEIAIVPFGNNNSCQDKYNIFTSARSNSAALLVRTIVDMKNFTLTTGIIVDNSPPSTSEFGSIAVGREVTADYNRYLYFMWAPGTPSNTGQIDKLIINYDGSLSAPSLLFTTTNAGAEFFSRELDLSPDGKWLAWASYYAILTLPQPNQSRYHFLQLDATGNYTSGSYHQFNIITDPVNFPDGSNTFNYTSIGFRGIEFWQSQTTPVTTKLFMGAGDDGIYSIDIPLPNPITSTSFKQVFGSNPVYGYSQIELAQNGKMYASSPYAGVATGNVGAFDPSISSPFIIAWPTSFTLGNPANPSYINPPSITTNLGGTTPLSTLYTLPDQIDGQDYSSIISPPVPTVLTANFTVSSGGTPTWTYGPSTVANNPWGTSLPVHINLSLKITGNTNLKIENMTFRFGQYAKVEIEPGSSLTLDGTRFTSDFGDPCQIGYTWQGIEVWGDRNASQFSQFSPDAQGKLTLKNNAKIEYAEWGARNWNSVTNTSTGGIINVNGGTFLNCRVDVEFNPYRNYTLLATGSKVFTGNRSSFYNCTFTTNDFYPFAAPPFNVTINNCNGINFNNCTFNIDPSLNLLSSRGIKSRDGGFHLANCTFYNFRQGVEAYRISRNEPVTIWKSNFIDNQTSIVLRNINNARVQRCTLDIGGNTNPNLTTHVGLLMQNTSGFIIEENLFRKSSNLVATSIWGTNTINSGSAGNEIYNNRFKELNNGNVAGLINRDNSNASIHGLQYICNEFDLNSNNDIYIYPLTTGTTIGIRTNQGTITTSAGNTFLNTGNNSINNNTTSVLTYYHSPTQTIQNTNGALTLVQAVTKNLCPSRIGIGDIIIKLNVAEIQFLNSTYDSAETAYLNLLYTYNQLMDGGSTNALLNQIQQSWSADAWVLRNQLLAQSPYLSQTILREVALGNILPQAMLLTVCMANPDATMDEPFLYFLQNEIPNPLPQYMIDAIIASWDVKTARTTMESTLAHYSHQMATTSDKLLADLYFRTALDNDSIVPTDTTDYNITIRYWLQRVQTLTAKYDLIENYFAANELTSAQSELDSIPGQFNLSQDQLTAYNDYIWFYTFRKNLAASNGNLAQLSETQINELIAFTEGKNNFAKGLAQNILCHYYNHCTEEDYDLTSGGNRMFHDQQKNTNLEINNVSAAPNPATTFTTFSYLLQIEKALLVISDVSGKEIERIVLNNSEGQLIWDTRNINNGAYYYSVTDGITKIAKGKVVVQK